jgi:DNA-binding XRE family transcriptional regulator
MSVNELEGFPEELLNTYNVDLLVETLRVRRDMANSRSALEKMEGILGELLARTPSERAQAPGLRKPPGRPKGSAIPALKALREKTGRTQDDFARIVGCSLKTVQRSERGGTCNGETIGEFAEALSGLLKRPVKPEELKTSNI